MQNCFSCGGILDKTQKCLTCGYSFSTDLEVCPQFKSGKCLILKKRCTVQSFELCEYREKLVDF